jgi:hypothetical protein
MDLLGKRIFSQLPDGISEFVIPRAVVKTFAFSIHDGDQVLGTLGNQPEHFFLIGQLPAYAVDLDLLVDRVQIKEKNERNQAAKRIVQGKGKIGVRLLEQEGKRSHPHR